MKHKQYILCFKIFFALLCLAAIVTEIVVLQARGTFNPYNFFSFFTIQSNIFAAVILLIAAYMYGRRSPIVSFLRGASTLYMLMTGAIFAVLLSNIDPRLLTAVPWDNIVLHYMMPIVMLIDWIVDRPNPPVRLKHGLVWLTVPLLYLAYTLVRGSVVEWYPYPFLNPAVAGGYMPIVVVSLIITIFVLVSVWVIIRLQYLVVQAPKRRVS